MSRTGRVSLLDEVLEEDDGTVWLVTYSDMMTLILVFFILLYTIFYIETERFKDAIATVQVEDPEGRVLNVIEYAWRKPPGCASAVTRSSARSPPWSGPATGARTSRPSPRTAS